MRKIIFHHITKTAGTSLIGRLKAAFQDRICPATYDDQLTPEMMQDERFVLYHGHFSFDMLEQFKTLNPDSFAFVFLRHPVNRVISQYYNWIDKERTRSHYDVIAKGQGLPPGQIADKMAKFEETIFHLSLAEFLAHNDPDIVDVVHNHQARYLSRRATYAANPMLGCVEAIQNLSTFYDFVGLTETYDVSSRKLMRKLAIRERVPDGEIRVNTNDVRKIGGLYREDSASIFKIIEANEYDLCVFHYALGLCAKGTQKGLDVQELLQLPEMT
jgi:hypothetical protein